MRKLVREMELTNDQALRSALGSGAPLGRRPRRGPLLLVAALVVLLAIGVLTWRTSGTLGNSSVGSALTATSSAGPTSTTAATATSAGQAGATSLPITAPATATSRPAVSATAPLGTSVPTTARGTSTPVPLGAWGGRGIRLVLTATGGSVEYDCAAGVITAPLVAGGGGTFEAGGAHAFQGGGPVDPGRPAARALNARYTGSTDGAQMRLTVTLPETGATLGPFTLGLDQPALLDRCG